MFRTTAIASAAFVLWASPLCQAGDDKPLTIGDAAPAIDIEHWVKGDKIDEFEKDKVYGLEFWATWCPPCVAAMPHLSKLQEKYKDYGVTFIGVSDEPLETVEKFLTQKYKGDGKLQNERARYRLTTDPDETVWKDYFKAAGRTGIPCTFIIGKTGEIEYIGHPMEMDEALEDVVHDKWDRAAFKKKFEAEGKISNLMSNARAAQRDGNWEQAMGILEQALELDPENSGIQLQMIQINLVNLGEYESGYTMARGLVEKNWENANLLNAVAWMIVDTEGIEQRDLKLAMKATKQSNTLTDQKEPALLDTLARVHYEQGDLKKAIKWQELASKLAGDDAMGRGIREVLEEYRKEAK
ncbi:MAG: redoxin domain-containing protein [Planctomycetota bacterium]|nr:redoxin domain-containing protein [Planctomycetota bacterium]